MIFVWSDFLFTLAQWYLSESDCSGEASQAVWSNSFSHFLILLPIAKLMPCLPLRVWVVTHHANCGIRLAIWASSCVLQWSFLLLFNHTECARESVLLSTWVSCLSFCGTFIILFRKNATIDSWSGIMKKLTLPSENYNHSEQNYHVGWEKMALGLKKKYIL